MRNIKNIIILVALLFATVVETTAQSTSSEVRNEIKTFLQREGFSPYIDDSDGTLCFKREGQLYWIAIGTNPLMIRINRTGFSFTGENALNPEKALIAANEVNNDYYRVKVYCSERIVGFAIETYIHNLEEFTSIIISCTKTLDGAYDKFIKYYNGDLEMSYSPNILSRSSGYNYSSSSSYSGNSNYSSSSNTFNVRKMFPVKNTTIGVTTINQLKSAGYKIRTGSNYSYTYLVEFSMSLYDWNNDGTIDYISSNYDVFPEQWKNYGYNPNLSYNQWKELLEKDGWTITSTKNEVKTDSNGRKYLSGSIQAKIDNGQYSIYLSFDKSDQEYSGYSLYSPNTLRSMSLSVPH